MVEWLRNKGNIVTSLEDKERKMELLRNELDYWIVDVNTFGPFPRNKLEVVNDVFMKPIAKLVVPHIYN